jgi:hypothetical protein
MRPNQTNTHVLTAGVATAASQLDHTMGNQRQYWNSGASPVFVKYGDNTVAASVTDHPIPPGAVITFSLSPADAYVSYYCATANTLYATAGEGL